MKGAQLQKFVSRFVRGWSQSHSHSRSSHLCGPSVQLNKIWAEAKALDVLFLPTGYQTGPLHLTVCIVKVEKNSCLRFMFAFHVRGRPLPQIECCSNNLSNFLLRSDQSFSNLVTSEQLGAVRNGLHLLSDLSFIRLMHIESYKRYAFGNLSRYANGNKAHHCFTFRLHTSGTWRYLNAKRSIIVEILIIIWTWLRQLCWLSFDEGKIVALYIFLFKQKTTKTDEIELFPFLKQTATNIGLLYDFRCQTNHSYVLLSWYGNALKCHY